MGTRSYTLAGVALLAWAVGLSWADPAPPPQKAAAPAVRSISGPITYANLTVFFLHGADVLPGTTILTLQDALAQKKAIVHETSQVNELAVENTSADAFLYLQSGDIVKGGKQDRAIAFDLLLPPKSGRVAIGSFCVEAGRWRQRGGEAAAQFGASTAQIAGKDLKLAINDTRRQEEVWMKVGEAQRKLSKNVANSVADRASPTSLQLSLENKQLKEKLTAYEKALASAIEGKTDVIGVALAVNGQVVGAEVYGSAALFRQLWPKLLKSAATEALAELDENKKVKLATTKAVEAFLADAAAGAAKEVATAAAGRLNAGLTQQQAQPAAQPLPARMRIVRYDGSKVLLIECQDKEMPAPTVVHRCYIAK